MHLYHTKQSFRQIWVPGDGVVDEGVVVVVVVEEVTLCVVVPIGVVPVYSTQTAR